MIYFLWRKWLTQRKSWVPTISLIPLLYLLGWLFVRPLDKFFPLLQNDDISLIGTLISFFIFILVLPSWVKTRWSSSLPWKSLGLRRINKFRELFFFLRGLTLASLVFILFISILFLGKWADGISLIGIEIIIDAIFVGLLVGIAEELIFRGWLSGEISLIFGNRWSPFFQAILFSFAHIKFTVNIKESLLIYLGLLFFGLLLSIRRILDKGSLWGAIGLHGGLVSGWFLIENGLINFSQKSPFWLFGVGEPNVNPIGGIGAICLMSLVLIFQRKEFARF